jgi:hypothetical protein
MLRIRRLAAIAVMLVIAATVPGFSGTFYSGSNTSSLVSVDTATGVGTVIGPFGVGGVFAGAFSPSGVFYTVTGTYSDPNTSQLATVDLTTGQASSVAPLPVSSIDMLQFSASGLLYGSEGYRLYLIDPSTGALTMLGSFGIPGSTGGMMDLAMDSSGTLYGVASRADDTGSSFFYTIDPSNGQATFLFSVATSCIMGMAFDAGDQLYATNFCAANSPLYSVDLGDFSVSIVGLTGIAHPHGGDIPRVPEPAAFVTTGLGLVALAGFRRARGRAMGRRATSRWL